MFSQGSSSVRKRRVFSRLCYPVRFRRSSITSASVHTELPAINFLYAVPSCCPALEDSGLPFAGTMPSADFCGHSDSSALARTSDISRLHRPPGVSHYTCYLSRRIYPAIFCMTIGHRVLGDAYPDGQALYPVSVRHNKYLSPASFRFLLAEDTLALDYKIPVITALAGLEDSHLRTCECSGMPGTPNV